MLEEFQGFLDSLAPKPAQQHHQGSKYPLDASPYRMMFGVPQPSETVVSKSAYPTNISDDSGIDMGLPDADNADNGTLVDDGTSTFHTASCLGDLNTSPWEEGPNDDGQFDIDFAQRPWEGEGDQYDHEHMGSWDQFGL